jgi:hypothetical protein
MRRPAASCCCPSLLRTSCDSRYRWSMSPTRRLPGPWAVAAARSAARLHAQQQTRWQRVSNSTPVCCAQAAATGTCDTHAPEDRECRRGGVQCGTAASCHKARDEGGHRAAHGGDLGQHRVSIAHSQHHAAVSDLHPTPAQDTMCMSTQWLSVWL